MLKLLICMKFYLSFLTLILNVTKTSKIKLYTRVYKATCHTTIDVLKFENLKRIKIN